MAGEQRETEIKFRVADAPALRRNLAAIGARFEAKFAEQNYFCDDAVGTLARGGRILRLRRSISETDAPASHGEDRLTYKEPLSDPRFKVRREIEATVGDLDDVRLILQQLGYYCREGYQKEREAWRLDAVLVTLDTLAFGCFVELEGPPAAVIETATSLGFDLAQGITKSYLDLAAEKASPQGG